MVLKRSRLYMRFILIETVPKKTENSILRNQKKLESLIFTGPKIFAGR